MKKVIYSIALVSVLTLAVSSCVKEEVKPQVTTNNSGGNGSDKGF